MRVVGSGLWFTDSANPDWPRRAINGSAIVALAGQVGRRGIRVSVHETIIDRRQNGRNSSTIDTALAHSLACRDRVVSRNELCNLAQVDSGIHLPFLGKNIPLLATSSSQSSSCQTRSNVTTRAGRRGLPALGDAGDHAVVRRACPWVRGFHGVFRERNSDGLKTKATTALSRIFRRRYTIALLYDSAKVFRIAKRFTHKQHSWCCIPDGES